MPTSRTVSWIFRAIYIPIIAFIFLLVAPDAVLSGRAFVTSIAVRTDCGDLRYTYLGLIPSYDKLPDPDRNALLAVAKTSPTLHPRWVPIRVDFAHGTNYFVQKVYRTAAAWARTDPHIARFILEDEASMLPHPFGGSIFTAIYPVISDSNGHLTINPNWKSWPPLQQYCQDHGYTP